MGECVLHNALERDFQEMLFPLDLMQTVLFQPKYRILHGFVTPNGLLAHLHCSLGVVIVLAVNFGRYWVQEHDYANKQTALVTSIHIFDSIFYTAYSVIICAVNVTQSRNNVQMVLKMQRMHRLIDDSSAELKTHRLNNWVNIVLGLVLFVIFTSFNYIYDSSDYFQLLFVMTLFYFDSNVIVGLQVIKFLERESRRWLRALARFGATCSETDHNELIKYFKEVDQQEVKLYQAYVDILDAFKLYRSIFQISILLLAVEVFVHPLVYIQEFLDRDKVNNFDYDSTTLSRIIPALWVVKNFALLVLVSAASEQFRLAARDVDAAGAVARAQPGCLVNVQKLCKKVCRLNAATRSSREPGGGGAGALDAALPLRVLALLATYTVVLLQFAFL